ncbi:NAD(P)-binding protein [Xylariaceae sp. FL0016]|nr:NAD(P)-binding protein [Xylariaceae sp. FL0016]
MSSQDTSDQARTSKSIFVTGANGYIGFAVSRAFVRAGWRVYGLVRRAEAAEMLKAEEIIPVLGSVSEDLAWLDTFLSAPATPPFDVLASCTEQFPFDVHYQHLVTIFTKLAQHAQEAGIRPLVLMSSGCKDYGTTGVHGSPGLSPHTEDAPLNPPAMVQTRCATTLDVFAHADLFDATVLRPTPVYGYGSSYYGATFDTFAACAGRETIGVPGDFNAIIHGCHVDDCAEAYVALAEHGDRSQVSGECFNISWYRYETAQDIGDAMCREYGISGGMVPLPSGAKASPAAEVMFGHSQWVDSGKIRRLTGWDDRRMLFAENVHAHRIAYDAAVEVGDAGIVRMRDRVGGAAFAQGLGVQKDGGVGE